MPDTKQKRMPTGISSLDPVLDGGIPPGSVVLLMSDIGAGNREFIYSSIITLTKTRNSEHPPENAMLPESIRYITFTKVASSIIDEIDLSFQGSFQANLSENVIFTDFSDSFFESSIVPRGWYSNSDIIDRFSKIGRERKNILAELSNSLNEAPDRSLIIFDSVTDIATRYRKTGDWDDFIGFLRGLQRVTKTWGSTIYLLLSSGILDDSKTAEIADCCDAVINFRWEESSARRRQRVMYFDKFRGVMPYLEDQELVRFAVQISSEAGFEVSNIRVII